MPTSREAGRAAIAPATISLPTPPVEPPRHAFPVLAVVAPVMGSAAIWAVTSSPFALLFAALGPLVAVASMGDARLTARRARRREARRFADECVAAERAIAEAHAVERRAREGLAPAAIELLSVETSDAELWRAGFGTAIPVRIGRGPVRSELRVTPAAAPAECDELRALRARAETLTDAPVVIDARLGVGFLGPPVLTRAAARAVTVQVAAALSPRVAAVRASADSESWLVALPHEIAEGADGQVWFVPEGGAEPSPDPDATGGIDTDQVVVAVGEDPRTLPRQVRVHVRVSGASATIERYPTGGMGVEPGGALVVELVSQQQAGVWAAARSERAAAEGLLGRESTLPRSVELAGLPGRNRGAPGGEPRGFSSLAGVIGVDAGGAHSVDLALHGPHAIVGGTTGSGKSELLVTWVIAMAAGRSPTDVTFLFVDFKGGAAFDPLRLLPHCVGIITDLDAAEAVRAMASLRAEIRHRERTLLAAGLRSIDEGATNPPFPRLVIVVDEYAAMVDELPELHGLFADLAARGRSLGIHLVLCTQRPSGVVRDGVLANCGLRISLRVIDRADSIAVVGTEAAAAIHADAVGRAMIGRAGATPQPVQVARASAADASAVAQRWASADAPRRPWCAPLPAVATAADLRATDDGDTAGGLPFALADLPEEQRRATASYSPDRDGNLLVVGAGRSGKSTFLAALARATHGTRVDLVRSDLAFVWDALERVGRADAPAGVLLIDDVDALIASCPDEWSSALIDLLGRALREGPARGVHVVLTAQRVSGAMHALAALCGSVLLLRMPSRQEHLLAGGDPDSWAPGLPPGGGVWRGNRVQVVLPEGRGDVDADTAGDPPDEHPLTMHGRGPLVVVSARPREFAERIRELDPGRALHALDGAGVDPRALVVGTGAAAVCIVGDPAAWQAQWGLLAALRPHATVLFDGCGVSDLRNLGIRELPPPPLRGARALWVLMPGEEPRRARLLRFDDQTVDSAEFTHV